MSQTVSPLPEAKPRMSNRTIAIITIVLAIVAVLASPNGPLGFFWRPAPGSAAPAGFQLPLFIIINIAEGVTFGYGIAFMLFGRQYVTDLLPSRPTLASLAYLGLVWNMVSWWPHDSMHIHIGENLNGLLMIEYIFHMTLMAGAAIVAYYVINVARTIYEERTQ